MQVQKRLRYVQTIMCWSEALYALEAVVAHARSLWGLCPSSPLGLKAAGFGSVAFVVSLVQVVLFFCTNLHWRIPKCLRI